MAVVDQDESTIGSLFSGYGGLDLGVQAVLGGRVVWHAEIEPAACLILEHHYPLVPNLGDVTEIDWAGVEPVDILTLGFPCQDVSAAGLKHGLGGKGERSGLWAHAVRAIAALRPSLVVIENVRGLLSASGAEPRRSGRTPVIPHQRGPRCRNREFPRRD